jgi:hypothetical protein
MKPFKAVNVKQDQDVFGRKKFFTVPQSMEDPLKPEDVVRKKYLDENQPTNYILWFGTSDTPSNASTEYCCVQGIQWYNAARPLFSLVEAPTQNMMPLSITIDQMDVHLLTAPGVGASRTFTLRDDAADTAAVVTISGVATTGTWNTGGVNIAAGSFLSHKTVPAGAPANTLGVYVTVKYHLT